MELSVQHLNTSANVMINNIIHLAHKTNLDWCFGPDPDLDLDNPCFRAWLQPDSVQEVCVPDLIQRELRRIRDVGNSRKSLVGEVFPVCCGPATF